MKEYTIKLAKFDLSVYEHPELYTLYLHDKILAKGRDYVFHNGELFINVSAIRRKKKLGFLKDVLDFIKQFTP